MGKTAIEWTDHVWNPVRGCTRVSEGCRNCYAERVAARFSGPDQPYEGSTTLTPHGPRWTGKVRLVEEALSLPLTWRKPRRIFVNSMSDLFHEGLSDADIDRVFAVMGACDHRGLGHVFQILTKRPARMRAYMNDRALHAWNLPRISQDYRQPRNVWLGGSIEDQATADARVPILLDTPAAVRFVSYEPALGPVDLRPWLSNDDGCEDCDDGYGANVRRCSRRDIPREQQCPRGFAVFTYTEHGPYDRGGAPAAITEDRVTLDLVIMGGESGPGARPMHPDWARSMRDQCAAAGVPFFFKQWGVWVPGGGYTADRTAKAGDLSKRWTCRRGVASGPPDTAVFHAYPREWIGYGAIEVLQRVGKRRAGRLLDGVEHNGMPDHG